MTRVTAHETAAREAAESVGLTMVRSEIKRMARATFDLFQGDKLLAEGLTCQEVIASATVVSGLLETVETTENETAAEAPTTEETTNTMPEEPVATDEKMPEEA